MLKNEELKQLSQVAMVLSLIREYELSNDMFYEDTGLAVKDIDRSLKDLASIQAKYRLKHIQSSQKANAYNKAHPEKHRKLNRDCYKRKKERKEMK